MKNLLTLVLALLCLAGQRVYADSSGVCGENLTWNLTDGILIISGEGAMTDWTAESPSPWDDSRDEISVLVVSSGVTSIGAYAFDSLPNLTRVSLPDGIKSINPFGFRHCRILENITLPASLAFIGESAFQGCDSLRGIVIPEKVRSLGKSTFGDCESLETIILSDSLETMDYSTFKYCISLKSVVIPKKVTMIERRLFDGCTALEEVTLPVGLTKIHYQAFRNCSSLKSIVIPELVTSIEYSAFLGCDNLTSVTVGNATPVELVNDVFSNRSNATLYVPAGSRAAYESADVWSEFDRILEFGDITFADSKVKEICVASWDTNGDGELSYEEAAAVASIGKTFRGNAEITSFDELQYFTSVETLVENAFNGCSLLGSVTLPANLKTISTNAFYASGLTSIEIPASVDSIAEAAFNSTPMLKSMTVAVGNTVYDSRNGCNGIIETATNTLVAGCQNTVIPSDVETIGASAFRGCTSLKSFVIPNGITVIENDAFRNCEGVTSVVIPSSVTHIGTNAFLYCWAMSSVTVGSNTPIAITDFFRAETCSLYVPAGSKSAYESASVWNEFKEIVEIENISFADSKVKEICVANWDTNGDGELSYIEAAAVASIGKAFRENTEITSFDELQYFTSVETLVENAFKDCSLLESVTLPVNLKTIAQNAFYASGLTSIEIPASVDSIAEAAFNSTPMLKSMTVAVGNTVYDSRNGCNGIIETATNTLVAGCQNTVIPSDVETIGASAFRGCTSLKSFVIPNGITVIGNDAFRNCEGLTSVVIPSSVTHIGTNAFIYCWAMSSVTVESNTPIAITDFYRAYHYSLYVPAGSKSAYESAYMWCSFKEIVEIQDVTAITLTNADFSGTTASVEGGRTAEGWSGTAFTAANGSLAEQWNKTFDNYQVLQNMPAGTYILSCQGFYRHGWDAYSFQNGTEELLAELYVNDSHSKIMSLFADSTYTLDPYTYPNTVDDANTAFNEKGQYKDNKVVYVLSEPGDLRIGVRKTVACAGDWTIFDNFKLEYAGSANAVEVNADSSFYLRNVATGRYLEAGNHFGTEASLGKVGVDVKFTSKGLSRYVIDTKVSNYGKTYTETQYLALDVNGKVYLDGSEQVWVVSKLDNGNYVLFNDNRYLNSSDTTTVLALGDLGETSEWQLLTKSERIASLDIVNANEGNPIDMTFMLPGAGFNQNDTRNASWNGNPAIGGAYENRNAEKWNAATFDVNQTLKGLPNGYYSVSVQGFYRVGSGGNNPTIAANEYAAGTPTLNAIFYANEASTPLKSIMTEAKTDADSLTTIMEGDLSYGFKTALGVVPHCQHGASHFFSEGLYTHVIIAEVVDSTLKVGVKKNAESTNDWTIFDNFQINYLGTEKPANIADGTYYLKNVATGLYLSPGNDWEVKASLSTIPFDIKISVRADGTRLLDTRLYNGNNKHYMGNASDGTGGWMDGILLGWYFDRLENGNYAITSDGTNYIGYADTSVVALDLTDVTSEAAQWQLLTKEQVMAELNENLAKATFKQPQDATFLIEGATFRRNDRERNKAWQGDPQFVIDGGNAHYAGQWVTSDSLNGSGFDVHQTLSNLPNGYYTVKVQGAYRGSYETFVEEYKTGTNVQRAYLYANDAQTPLMHLLDDPKEGSSFDTENYQNTEWGYIPRTRFADAHFMKDGHWSENSVLAEVTDGTLRLGVKKDTIDHGGYFTLFDNFELWYMGTEIPAYNAFVLSDTTLRAGQSMLLPVALTNESEFTAFQCDIYLPEGVTLQTKKGKYDITLDEERMNDQAITSALQEDGSIRMAVASLTSSLFSGNSGNLFYLNLLGGENISGDLAISIKNIHISAVDGTMYDLEDVTATITVPSYTPADVNDDGVIAINDVVLTINAVLGTYADNFVFAAADMNGDNQIMINDVVQVINSVLGLNTTSVLTARHIVRETLDINETQNGFGMSLSNAGGYVAMQYDMTLPAGVSINDIRVTAGSNHSVSFREVGDGQVRVAVVSQTNEAFASGSLLEVSVSAESATSISITNAYVATRRGVMVEVSDAEVQLTRGGATGIQAVGIETAPADIFDLSGRIVKKAATSLEGLDKGVYLMNGKKVVVK